jgi:hypothetical protein
MAYIKDSLMFQKTISPPPSGSEGMPRKKSPLRGYELK